MSKTLRAALRCFAGSIGVLAAHGAAQAQDQTAPMERVEEVIVTGTRAPKAVDKIPGAINVVSEAEVSRSLSLTAGRHCRARTHRARLFRIVAGGEQPRRDAARPRAAAPVRRHSAEHAAARRQPQQRVHRYGRRRTHRGDQRSVRGRRHRRSRRHHQLHLEGRDRAGPEVQRLHEPVLAVRGRQRQLEGRRHAHVQVGRLRHGAERLARRPRHHLRRERPAHRPERQQLLGGLGDREPVPEGRHGTSAPTTTSGCSSPPATSRSKSKGGYHWVEGSRALRIPDTSERGPAARHRRRCAGGHGVQRLRAVRAHVPELRSVRRQLQRRRLHGRPGDALPGRQRRRSPGSVDRADRPRWSISPR